MPRTLLVICSSPEGFDYPRLENQAMLRTLLGDDFIPTFMGEYPGDLPIGTQFDAILFGGCNVLTWLFKGYYEYSMERLSSVLRDDGIVIFTENKAYVTKHGEEDHYNLHRLSISLQSIKLHAVQSNDDTGLKQDIIAKWKQYFTETTEGKYIVYKKVVKGGRRKKSITKRRKRKTRSHK